MKLQYLMVSFLLVVWSPGVAGATESNAAPSPNCAVASLFMLSHVLGNPVPLASFAVESSSQSESDTSSIDDVMRMGKRHNLDLQTRILKTAQPLDRPLIAFLQMPDEGHFIVVKPVGTRGTMVQILDPARLPRIVDLSDLVASQGWTGIVLVPTTGWERWRPLVYSIAATLSAWLLISFTCSRQPLRRLISLLTVGFARRISLRQSR